MIIAKWRQARREGEGESFPGPRDVWGPRHRSKILKMMFQMASFWPKICIKSIFGLGSARTPLGEFTTFPRTPDRMVRGHLSPRFLPVDAFGVSISRHTEWARVTGPRDNVFPGPAVALDGPDIMAVGLSALKNWKPWVCDTNSTFMTHYGSWWYDGCIYMGPIVPIAYSLPPLKVNFFLSLKQF